MCVEFQVWQSGQIIYRMDFPTDESWQYAEFAKTALNDFHERFPSVSLLDANIQMKWAPHNA